jgi:hypothetical protein
MFKGNRELGEIPVFLILLRQKSCPHTGEDLLHGNKKQPVNEIFFAPLAAKRRNIRFFLVLEHAGNDECPDYSHEHQVICPGYRYCLTAIHEFQKKDNDGTDKGDITFRNNGAPASVREYLFRREKKKMIPADYFSLTQHFNETLR